MNEITEKVTLTNAVDEALVRTGQMAECDVRTFTVDAVVNTDKIRSVVSKRIAEALGVSICNGIVRGPILFECLGGQTIDDAVIGEDGVIIGRTVVAKIQNPSRIKPHFGPISVATIKHYPRLCRGEPPQSGGLIERK